MFVDDGYKTLARGVIASGAGVIRAAESVVSNVEEPLEHNRVWYAGEVSLSVSVRGRGRQVTGRVVVSLVVGGGDLVPVL
jgi:hypothetical protein